MKPINVKSFLIDCSRLQGFVPRVCQTRLQDPGFSIHWVKQCRGFSTWEFNL